MRVVVLGGGVIGVTTAYYLAKDGHDVTVVDRNDLAACETSYANAGLVAPAHAFAWASPKAPRILLKSLVEDDQALRLEPRIDPRMWWWCLKFLAQCTEARARLNTERKLRLCTYSVERLNALVEDTGIEYDGLADGNVYVYRSRESFDAGVAHTSVLRERGLELEVVDRDRLAEIEPALVPVKERIAGGIFAPGDQSGDARMFSRNLAAHCAESLAVEFRWGTTVKSIDTMGDRVERISTDRGDVVGDTYVLALGVEAPFLASPIGVRLPIYPCKGYSVTVPAVRDGPTPRIGGVDEDNLVAFCPMGDRLRITSTAEFSGYERGHRPEDFRAMFRAVKDLFPHGGDWARPDYWAGLRPMTPTTVPILGFARLRNLVLNVGHGHIGWTMSCGSGKAVADLVWGRDPEVDLEGILYA